MSRSRLKIKTTHTQSHVHAPVLLDEVIECLAPKKGERYLDLTAGYGGHAGQIIARTDAGSVLVDRDPNAIEYLRTNKETATAGYSDARSVTYMQKSFADAAQELADDGQQFDIILADLGLSSPHIDTAHRGFSFLRDGPLDMRMDTTQELTAEQVVNTYTADQLTDILRRYGEEPKAKRMSQAIIDARPLQSTTELAAVAKRVWPGYSRTHPATRLFQAVRIEVNDELGQVTRMLTLTPQLLRPGGRVGIITFHSLEDRLVKRFFKEMAGNRYDAVLQELTKKPITAREQEHVTNPRARSAKLRVAMRNTT